MVDEKKELMGKFTFMICFAVGVAFPGVVNYACAIWKKFSLFWRQNLLMTVWYQTAMIVIVSLIYAFSVDENILKATLSESAFFIIWIYFSVIIQ